LEDRLAGRRIKEKDERLAADEQGGAGEALHNAKRDQQVQTRRDGGKSAGGSHDDPRRKSVKPPAKSASNQLVENALLGNLPARE
jgi:hypothetical protein